MRDLIQKLEQLNEGLESGESEVDTLIEILNGEIGPGLGSDIDIVQEPGAEGSTFKGHEFSVEIERGDAEVGIFSEDPEFPFSDFKKIWKKAIDQTMKDQIADRITKAYKLKFTQDDGILMAKLWCEEA